MAPPVARRVAAVVFLLVLLIQVGVPLARLGEPRPARFGWQMYSSVRPLPEIRVVYSDQTTREVAPRDVLGHLRSDYTDLERYLIPHLLRLYPGAVSVECHQFADFKTCEYP